MTAHEARAAYNSACGRGWGLFQFEISSLGFFRRGILSRRGTILDVMASDNAGLALFQVIAGILVTIAWIDAHGKNPYAVFSLQLPVRRPDCEQAARTCTDEVPEQQALAHGLDIGTEP